MGDGTVTRSFLPPEPNGGNLHEGTESDVSDTWPTPLWTPSPAFVNGTRIDRFRRDVYPDAADSDALIAASLADPGGFWRSVWDWCGLVGDPGDRTVDYGERFRDTTFLPDSSLNFAENLLADREGAGRFAIISVDEAGREINLTWDDLRSQVGAMTSALVAMGVEAGDRVAAWMPHRPETIVMFLAVSSIGAVFTSTSCDFGVEGVLDRFGQTEPKVLLAADGYRYGGREFRLLDRLDEITRRLDSLEHVVVVGNLANRPAIADDHCHWVDVLAGHDDAETSFTRLPTNHPVYILYSSGTTGKPKCIVHRSGGVLLKHASEQQLHSDIGAGDVVFYFTTCGWMMWNWLVSCLGTGATIVLVRRQPRPPLDWHALRSGGAARDHAVRDLGQVHRQRDEVRLPARRSPRSRVHTHDLLHRLAAQPRGIRLDLRRHRLGPAPGLDLRWNRPVRMPGDRRPDQAGVRRPDPGSAPRPRHRRLRRRRAACPARRQGRAGVRCAVSVDAARVLA